MIEAQCPVIFILRPSAASKEQRTTLLLVPRSLRRQHETSKGTPKPTYLRMDSRQGPKYAVLGATGNCGSALIQTLLTQPSKYINAYCRDRTKLECQLGDTNGNGRVHIFEGNLSDVDLIAACMQGCHAVFLCVSTNDNVPGCHMAQDAAAVVVQALRRSKESRAADLPKVVLLSSGTVDEPFSQHVPSLLLPVLLRSASHVYRDIKIAEEILQAQSDWLTSIYMKPGALSVDQSRGYALSITEQNGPTSYSDLAAAMIEAADDPDGQYDQKSVSTVCTHGPAKFPPGTVLCILLGLLRHYIPWLHPYLPRA